MGSIVKGIVSAVTGKSSAKKAYNAQLGGLQGAVDEQNRLLTDITSSQNKLRDANIADLEGLAGRAGSEYDDLFNQLNDLLQTQYDNVSALQAQGFDSVEQRLLSNLDDAILRSQQSYDYAEQNLMPYISKGREAFDAYTQKALEGFEFKPYEQTYEAPDAFQYDEYQTPDAFQYEPFTFNYEESPGYQFVLDSALNAATNTAAAQGMGISGATQKALADRAAGLAATDFANQYNRARNAYEIDRNQAYNAYQDYNNRDLIGYQYNANQAFNQYKDNADREALEFVQNYNIDRANQNSAYENYRNQLGTLSSLSNIGLQNEQALINREQGLAEFEMQAKKELAQALASNDVARANALIQNILTLTGGQGRLAEQAIQIKNGIDQAVTAGTIDQRTTAQNNIDNTRSQVGTNLSNLSVNKGNAESNYQITRGQLQNQLLGSIIDGGIMGASAIAGGAGAFGGAGGLSGVMNGLNFGSELSSFGSGQTFSPQALNYVNTGQYINPQTKISLTPYGGLAGMGSGLGF